MFYIYEYVHFTNSYLDRIVDLDRMFRWYVLVFHSAAFTLISLHDTVT